MRAALVTGANKGIGFEITKQLGQRGFKVVIAGRNANRLEEAQASLYSQKIDAETLLMDVGNADSIKTAAQNFKALKLELDALVNNAAVLLKEDKSLLQDSENVWQRTIEVNAYGILRVIKAFLPFMKKPARIVNMSSSSGTMSEPLDGWAPAYGSSKTFLNMITRQLALELQKEKISVNAVCPGWVKTDMGGVGASRSIEKGAETPVWLATEAPFTLTGKFFRDRQVINW